MYLHLTIAQLTVFWPAILGVGLTVGFLSGMFGVGGGFLISPMLMFLGVPTEVAVATGANQAVATSATAALSQWRLGNVDLKISAYALAGGTVGSVMGVYMVAGLRALGQIELVIAICYAVLLGILGLLMLIEGLTAIRRAYRNAATSKRTPRPQHGWIDALPLKTRFRRSKRYMSIILPVVMGLIVGILGAVMGVGGGFVLVPAMVYLLKMPTQVVIGTSLVQVLVISAITTLMHASTNKSVDMELAALLIVGGVFGAYWGARAGNRIPSEQLRALLGLLVLAVGIRFGLTLLLEPADVYSLTVSREH